MVSDKDRRHADLMAAFFSQLGVAFIAGGVLQLMLLVDRPPSATAMLFMIGLGLHGIAHILVERSHGGDQ